MVMSEFRQQVVSGEAMIVTVMDSDHCYRIASPRDGRFDGMFVTAVTSTRIYCRPSCPAMTPKRSNVVFYPTPAAAQQAGFRACKRCLPDAAPGSPQWDRRADAVARAVRMIWDGVVEREGVGGLAARLGYSTRHLHRLMLSELGTGALQLSLAHKVSNARALIETSTLPITDVAFASGFGSVRQFNELVQRVYASTPLELRNRAAPATTRDRGEPVAGAGLRHTVTARLCFRHPYDHSSTLAFLAHRAIPGVEHFNEEGYSRVMRLPRSLGVVTVPPQVDTDRGARDRGAGGQGRHRWLSCRLDLDDIRDYPAAVARVRRMLDLDADCAAVEAALAADPWIRPLVEARPGLSLPGTSDGAELALRAVLGQQVSLARATAAASRLAADLSDPHPGTASPHSGTASAHSGTASAHSATASPLRYPFPSVEAIAEMPIEKIALPSARAATLQTLARAIRAGDVELDVGADRERATQALCAIKGIGPWTVGYVRMRALGDPDVFLQGDVGVRRALESRAAVGSPDPARWRPWASYAVAHLWAAQAGRKNLGPGRRVPTTTEGDLT
jgi:AraC family transcriptional regulator of adaptative response / DNA-3-methyladenine glycosylase II